MRRTPDTAVQNGFGSEMRARASRGFCLARTCGGHTGGSGGTTGAIEPASFFFETMMKRATPAAMSASTTTIPITHHSHHQSSGMTSGALIGLISFVAGPGVVGGMIRAEFVEAISGGGDA